MERKGRKKGKEGLGRKTGVEGNDIGEKHHVRKKKNREQESTMREKLRKEIEKKGRQNET